MPKPDTKEMQNKDQLPPGYPTTDNPTGKKCCPQKTAKKGERGFLEGCLFALCCCWVCDACF